MLIAWEALAFVFAVMPAIVLLAYCYECGRKGERPQWKGYLRLLRLTSRAKKESYRKTAQLFAGQRPSAGWVVKLIAWLFALIVTLVGPGIQVVLICFVASVPASFFVYFIGKRQGANRNLGPI